MQGGLTWYAIQKMVIGSGLLCADNEQHMLSSLGEFGGRSADGR
jgi:hypothetical protein